MQMISLIISTMTRRDVSHRSLLRDGPFLRLWTSSTCSGVATWALPFVLGVGVAQGHWGATTLGLVLAVRSAGFLVVMPLAGVAADRLPHRRVVRDAGIIAAIGTVVLTAALAHDQLAASLVAAAAIGAGQATCRPTFQAMVREQVAPASWQPANAAMSLSVRVATLLGPALTALASQWISLTWILLATAVMWVLTAALPRGGDPTSRRARHTGQGVDAVEPGQRATAPEGLAGARRPGPIALAHLAAHDLREGVQEARRHPWFVAGLGGLLPVMALGYSATSVALPLVSRDRFGGETVLAAAITAYTVGAIAGAALVTRWRPVNVGWWAFAGLGAYALVPLALAISPSPLLVLAAYALGGIGIEVFNIPWFTATQREVPPERLARVTSLDFVVSYGCAPLGLALLAPAISAWGLTPVLLGCAAACVLGAALAATPRTSRTLSNSVSTDSVSTGP